MTVNPSFVIPTYAVVGYLIMIILIVVAAILGRKSYTEDLAHYPGGVVIDKENPQAVVEGDYISFTHDIVPGQKLEYRVDFIEFRYMGACDDKGGLYAVIEGGSQVLLSSDIFRKIQ